LWNDPSGVEALTFMADMQKEGGGHADVSAFTQGMSAAGAQMPFFTGKMSMIVHGNWVLADVQRFAPQMEIGMAPEPVPDRDGQRATMAGGYFWMLMNGPQATQKKDTTWELVKHLLEDANLLEFCKVRAQLPAKKSTAADAYFTQGGHKPFVDAIAWSVPYFELPYGRDLNMAINEARDLGVSGQANPKQALDEAVRKSNLAIEAYFKERPAVTR
jgi:multiple sugar transport system substrate-binding protein